MYAAIDFGTSNCLITAIDADSTIPIPLDGDSFLLKSHLFIPEPTLEEPIIDEAILSRRVTEAKRKQTIAVKQWEESGRVGRKPLVRPEDQIRRLERNVLARELKQRQKELLASSSPIELMKAGAPVLSGSQALREHLINQTPGRFIRSPKAFLGVNLSHRMREFFTYAVSTILRKLKEQAEAITGAKIDKALIGRPINFHGAEFSGSNDQAISILREAAEIAGFTSVEFEFEPYAASIGVLEEVPHKSTLLVVDIGGGTTDCSMLSVERKSADAPGEDSVRPLAFAGRRVGGLEFDREIGLQLILPHFGLENNVDSENPVPKMFFTDVVDPLDVNAHSRVRSLSRIRDLEMHISRNRSNPDLSRLFEVYAKKRDDRLKNSCELAKQWLAKQEKITLPLKYIESDFTVELHREELHGALETSLDKICQLVREAIQLAQIEPSHLMFTGGGSKLSLVREKVMSSTGRVQVVEADEFSAVEKGLAELAKRHLAA